MGCFRTDYVGRGELAERQQKLAQFLDKVKSMAEQYNLVVLMVSSLSIPLLDCLTCARRIRYNLIQEPVQYLPASTVANLSEDTSLPMHRQPGFCFVKVAEKSVLRKSSIHPVCDTIRRGVVLCLTDFSLETVLNAKQPT
jgi:Rad51